MQHNPLTDTDKPIRAPYSGRFIPSGPGKRWLGTPTCDLAPFLGRTEGNLLASLDRERPGKPADAILYCDATDGLTGSRSSRDHKTKLVSYRCIKWMMTLPQADKEALSAVLLAFPFKRHHANSDAASGDQPDEAEGPGHTALTNAERQARWRERREAELQESLRVRQTIESKALAVPERFSRIHTICKATPGTIGGRECDVVDAQNLYDGLGVTGTPFRDWVRRKVEDNPEFTEGVDFCRAELRSKKAGSGGHNAKVVLLTLDTAKRVAMAEGGEIGKLVRSYYLWTEGVVEEIAANPAGLGNQQLVDILARMEARDARQEIRDAAIDARFEQMMSLILANNHRQQHAFSNMSPAPIRTRRRRGQMSITQYRGHAKSILGVKVQYSWIEDIFVRKGWAERGAYLDKLLATDAGVESGYLVNFSPVVRDEDGSEKAYPSTLHLTEHGVEWLSGVLRGRNPDGRQSDFFREDADGNVPA